MPPVSAIGSVVGNTFWNGFMPHRSLATFAWMTVFAFAESYGVAEVQAEAVPGQQGNPLEFNIETIKRGKQLFTLHCIRCHGTDGRGDTEMREFLKTPPSDLSDGQWLYGNSGEAIFDVIRQGRAARDMPAFSSELSEERIWQVIHYIDYLGGRRP